MTVYLLPVEVIKSFSENFANLMLGVPITEKIGRKCGSPL